MKVPTVRNIAKLGWFSAFGAVLMSSLSCQAPQVSLSVSEQTTLKATPQIVWSKLGAFNGLNNWHPAVAKSDLTGTGTKKGDVRLLTLGDGATIKEELLNYDNSAMSYTYAILESPLPVEHYESTIAVKANDDGTSTVIWSSTFDAKGASDEEAINAIKGVYTAGLQALAKLDN